MANAIYNLPEQEQKIMNFSTMEINEAVKLGDRVQDILDNTLPLIADQLIAIEAGTPVNAAASSATLNINGVVVHGETVQIGEDIYEFLADEAQLPADPDNIPVDITANTTASAGVLTLATQPMSGDKITLGTKEYTWVPVGTATADGEIDIGSDIGEAQANFVAAVNGTDLVNAPHPLVSAGEFSPADECTITALVGGTAGDAIATDTDLTDLTDDFAAAALAGGADCTAANAVTALVAAVNAFDTQGVAAADGDGNTVVLTAEVAGEAGDEIAVAETMDNGAFANAAEAFAGGVDGTVAEGPKLLIDETYLYACFDENTPVDANWRRIALGNVF